MKLTPSIISAPCHQCSSNTDHFVLKTKTHNNSRGDIWWNTEHQMIECRGCHSISLKKTSICSEDEGEIIEYFPPPISRKKPAWAIELLRTGPDGLSKLLNEVYSALHANSLRLGAMGARALLDMTMTDAVGDLGGFEQKLNALEKGGFISTKNRKVLEAALDTGNAASHRGHCPTAEELNLVMDIVENVIDQICVLPNASIQLKKSTPKRKKTK